MSETTDRRGVIAGVLAEHRQRRDGMACSCVVWTHDEPGSAFHRAHVAEQIDRALGQGEGEREGATVRDFPEVNARHGDTPCRRSSARNRWECITWPGKPTAYPCAHDHAHCDFIGCVEHIDGMHVDYRGDAIVHVGCHLCRSALAEAAPDQASERSGE